MNNKHINHRTQINPSLIFYLCPKMIKTFLVILLVCVGFVSEAQEDWLLKAQKMYDLGKIEKIHDYLTPFLPKASKAELISAYRLLILTNIYEKKNNDADSLMNVLLNFENEYTLQSSDSIGEFADLYNSYRTNPKYGFSFVFGYITPQVTPLKNYGTNNLLENNYKYSSNSLSFNVGLNFTYYLYKDVSLDAGLIFTLLNYKNKLNLNEVMSLDFAETQSILTLPISLRYSYTYKKIKPFILTGFSVNKLLSSSAQVSRHFNGDISPAVTGPVVDITNSRASYSYALNLGLGFEYKIKHALLGFQVNYSYALNSAVTPDSRYANPDLIYKYYYVDNDFKIDFFSVSFRYTYLLYSPKKQIIK